MDIKCKMHLMPYKTDILKEISNLSLLSIHLCYKTRHLAILDAAGWRLETKISWKHFSK